MPRPLDSQHRPPRRVAVTALGIVSPLGSGAGENERALREGRDCVAEVTMFDTAKCRAETAGHAPALEPWHFTAREWRRLHRASHMMIHAARELLAGDAAFAPEFAVIGTTSGGMSFGEEFFRAQIAKRRGRAGWVANYPPQKSILDAMQSAGWRAPMQIIANACASGTNAIGHAFQLVRAGKYLRVLCGGYDAISEMVFAGFDSLQAATMDKVRPFDKARTGLVLGEGAALLALEEMESARARGATILAEVTGYGISTDNHHLTQPHPSGIGPEMAMRRALEDAGLSASAVDYINAHGTATPFNDASEGAAIAKLFDRVPVSSTKGMMGHSLGAAGAIEAVFSILALRGGFLPPNINYREADPAFDLDIVANTARTANAGCVVSNSFGFGGTNASIVIESGVESRAACRPDVRESNEQTPRTHSTKRHTTPDSRRPRIAGIGCVTPLGCVPAEILRSGERATLIEVVNTETGATHLAAPIPPEVLATLAPLNREPRLRRASPISLFAAAAGKAALADSSIAFSPEMKSRLAIVFGVSSGGVQYTRRFYEQVVKQGANAASPMLFPETVYNAPASHLAAMLGVDGATYTLVGDGTVGLQALQLGAQLLDLGSADHILVVAAEELDWILLEAHRAWGLTARDASGKGAVLSEGAAAVLLSREGRARIEISDGVSFLHPGEAATAMREALRPFAQLPPPGMILDSTNGTWADAAIAAALAGTFPSTLPPAPFANKSLGTSLGSSALLQVVLATAGEKASTLIAALGWNQQAAAARIIR